jgi:hypothetical protein
MTSKRFEMRIDSNLLEHLDQWRQGEDDTSSRAEAVRRLIEAGLAHNNKGCSDDDLDRFSRFREGHRDLNSHCPTLENYGRMLSVFEPIRQALAGRRLNGWARGNP